MKKIININLSGRVIPIEDSAYEKLQAYIESLRRYFAREESRDEIINDIESRISELLHDKIRKGATSITDIDIQEIEQSMGRPEDFEAEEAETIGAGTTGQQNTNSSSSTGGSTGSSGSTGPKKKGRLYRDSNDKFIGGVCSGIAAYLNVDPAIVRIIFAIITFGGFGLGFVAYILLWMILPPKDLEVGYSGKRLYRNPDDKILGGVASGLAAYFHRNTSTIRLIFAAPIILSVLVGILDGVFFNNDWNFFPNIFFGSITSTFILGYVILWMVLPEAHSTYEKMEMRGERVDVNSIRQNMKERMKSWGEEVRETAQNISDRAKEFTSNQGATMMNDLGETTRRTGRGIGHAIGVLFKVFFLFIAGTIAFALFVAFIALLFGGFAWWPINNFLWTSQWQQIYAWGTLVFFFAVPLIGFIIWLFRRIIRVKSKSNYLGWTFACLWTIGWFCAIALTASMVKDHREREFDANEISIVQPLNGKMVVTVTQPKQRYTGRFDWMNDGGEGWDLSNDTLKLSTVDFEFVTSRDSLYHVVVKRYSHGRNVEDAKQRAANVQYSVYSRDSLLDLGSSYAIDKNSKFRWQYIEIEIHIPVGKRIRFDRSVNTKLNVGSFDLRSDEYSREHNVYDYRRNYRPRPDVDYVMGADNMLRDASGMPVPVETIEQHPNTETDSTIEKQRRKVEEEQRKLRQLEENKGNGKRKEIKTKKSVEQERSLSGMLSSVDWYIG